MIQAHRYLPPSVSRRAELRLPGPTIARLDEPNGGVLRHRALTTAWDEVAAATGGPPGWRPRSFPHLAAERESGAERVGTAAATRGWFSGQSLVAHLC